MRQLVLPYGHASRLTEDEFLPHPGAAAASAWLERSDDWPGGRLALWGGAGFGKTHLLHVWAERTGARLLSGPALRHDRIHDRMPGPLAVDDADLVPHEPTLLHILNAAAEAGHPVLLAARTAPARWPVALPDLASRLRAITAVPLGPAGDAFLRALLARLLSERQLRVAPPVQDWLLATLPREPGVLREAALLLDHAGLAAGRGITRPLATHALRNLMYDTSATDDPDRSPPHPGLF